MPDAAQNQPARPSLVLRGVRRLRCRLGLPPPVRMMPEASEFIAEYREWLGRCIAKADEYLAASEGRGVMFYAGQGRTYEVQKHEGGTGWPHLRSGGVFVLDRADWNGNRYLGELMAEHSGEVDWHGTFKETSSADPFEFTIIVKK